MTHYISLKVYLRLVAFMGVGHWRGKLWTQSFFVETIGNANEETIRQYAQIN